MTETPRKRPGRPRKTTEPAPEPDAPDTEAPDEREAEPGLAGSAADDGPTVGRRPEHIHIQSHGG